jgi:hypothetical protein
MGFYHKWSLTLVARIASLGWGDLRFDPPRMQIFCHPCQVSSVGPACQIFCHPCQVSLVGPACQVGPDPHARSDRRVGPACQVGPTRGTRVSGWTDAWDPRVRTDRHVGPMCKVGLKNFKGKCSHISKIDTWILHRSKIDTWILHISKIDMWQFNYFKYILN